MSKMITPTSIALDKAAALVQKEIDEIESFDDVAKHIKDIKFRLFHWSKSLMPAPYWTAKRKRYFVDQYGGEDSAEYKHNVEGEDGDPENRDQQDAGIEVSRPHWPARQLSGTGM